MKPDTLYGCLRSTCKTEYEQLHAKMDAIYANIPEKETKIQLSEIEYQLDRALQNNRLQKAEKLWEKQERLRTLISEKRKAAMQNDGDVIAFRKCKFSKCDNFIKAMLEKSVEGVKKFSQEERMPKKKSVKKIYEKKLQEFTQKVSDIVKGNTELTQETFQDVLDVESELYAIIMYGSKEEQNAHWKQVAFQMSSTGLEDTIDPFQDDERLKDTNSAQEATQKLQKALSFFHTKMNLTKCIMKHADCRRMVFEQQAEPSRKLPELMAALMMLYENQESKPSEYKKIISKIVQHKKKQLLCMFSKKDCVREYIKILSSIIAWTDATEKLVSSEKAARLGEMRTKLEKARASLKAVDTPEERLTNHKNIFFLFYMLRREIDRS